MEENEKLHAMRHSLAHITAAAVKRLWPEAKFGVGPVIENGFYYDIDVGGDQTISVDDFASIEKVMKDIIAEDQPFERFTKSIDEAIAWAEEARQPYKKELLNDLKRAGTTIAKDLDAAELGLETSEESKVEDVSFYRNGDFTDLCRGPHVESTGRVGVFKLQKVAGAYWRGKEGNPQMQRLYGVGFQTQEELSAYLQAVEGAKLRDHRLLGKQLDLFAFSDLVGPGLPLFTPRGTLIRNQLKSLLLQVGRKYGGQEVQIPHLAKRDLYVTSGHAHESGHQFDRAFRLDTAWSIPYSSAANHDNSAGARQKFVYGADSLQASWQIRYHNGS